MIKLKFRNLLFFLTIFFLISCKEEKQKDIIPEEETQELIDITIFDPTNSPLAWSSITEIKFDSDNNLWLSTYAYGIYKFDGQNWIHFNETNSPFTTGAFKDVITHLHVRGNDIYAVLERTHVGQDTFIYKYSNDTWEEILMIEDFGLGSSIFADINGNIWLNHPSSHTLYLYKNNTLQTFREEDSPLGLNQLNYYTNGRIIELSDEKILIINGNYIHKIDINTLEWESILPEIVGLNQEAFNAELYISGYAESEEEIYLSTNQNLVIFKNGVWKKYKWEKENYSIFDLEYSPSSNKVYCASDESLQIFNLENETWEVINHKQIEGIEWGERFASRLEFSRDKRLYVASDNGKLLIFPETFE